MSFHEQKVIPAVRKIKDFEELIDNGSHQYIILLNMHVGQLRNLM